MNYSVPSCALWNVTSIGMGDDCFYKLVRSNTIVCHGLIVACLHLEVPFGKQKTIANVELSCFVIMKSTLFVGDTFEDIVNVVAHCSYLVDPFFYARSGRFIVIVKVYGMTIKHMETSVQ